MESIRDLLTQAIAENPYWNSRKYHALISKEMDCTYQGVHKVIRQLVEEGVLEDRNHTFSLSRKWLLRNIDFSKGALTKLEDNPQNFFEYPDYIEFTREFFKILDKIPEAGPCYAYWKHAWPRTAWWGIRTSASSAS
ncbi:MAG: hypothetical protein Q7T16_06650 [Candidatus Burarchaeum sp.]|nr:hypothetical protein [Candidatus Burarchaeum sp.]MDO8340307.1 hypothetical protein [Candidatus Burarchaeum sp.]